MTFDQLEYFMSCASCLNFSLAAKYHYVSVSTLSRNISALEEELGVKLFERGYHGHALTREGVRFFDFAEHACSGLADFSTDMEKAGIKNRNADVIRIACYPFDGAFSRIVECFSQLPSEQFGKKKYKVQFMYPGTAVKAVLSGSAHMGVANNIELQAAGDTFSKITMFRSSYTVRAAKGSELSEYDSLSTAKLISLRNKFSDYLPPEYLGDELLAKEVKNEDDLRLIAQLSLEHINEFVFTSSDEIKKKCLLLPKALKLPPLEDMSTINLSGNALNIEYSLFYKNAGVPGSKMQELRDHIRKMYFEY